ncbi:hypothetical protein DMUE_2193 [Dictyocoela muelleri]|nr:hypothetical protein DMUE_2193 [Dictyocoela muelleri]
MKVSGLVGNTVWQYWVNQCGFGEQLRLKQDIVTSICQKRDAETLIPIIKDNIEDKSYVVSEKWAAYKKAGYFKDSVCHKYNFVDPNTKPTLNVLKIFEPILKIKQYSYVIRPYTITDHLNVFIFFRSHKNIEFGEFIDIILN